MRIARADTVLILGAVRCMVYAWVVSVWLRWGIVIFSDGPVIPYHAGIILPHVA